MRSLLLLACSTCAALLQPLALPVRSAHARSIGFVGVPTQQTRASRAPAPVCQRRGGGGKLPYQRKPVVERTPINDEIAADEVRVLVDVPGGSDEMLGVMSRADAIAAAEERGLDLVLVGPKSEPPVCKIVSYDKYRFNAEKKKKEQQKAVKGQVSARAARRPCARATPGSASAIWSLRHPAAERLFRALAPRSSRSSSCLTRSATTTTTCASAPPSASSRRGTR